MEEFKFRCEFCDYGANRRDYMKKHMMKKYPCNGTILQEEIDYIKDKTSGNTSVIGLKNENKFLKKTLTKIENKMDVLKNDYDVKYKKLYDYEKKLIQKYNIEIDKHNEPENTTDTTIKKSTIKFA